MDSMIRTSVGAVLTLALFAVSPLAQVTKIPPAASGATWGSITGTLSAQADLQTALDAKATGNQAVSTTSDVVFGSVETGSIDIAGVSFTRDLGVSDLLLLDGVGFSVRTTVDGGGAIIAAQNLSSVGSSVAEMRLETPESVLLATAKLTADGFNEINSIHLSGFRLSSFTVLDLNPTDGLTINGTPGVTNAAGCAAHTKGICTTSASPDDSPAALRLEIAELRSLIAPLLPTRSRQ